MSSASGVSVALLPPKTRVVIGRSPEAAGEVLRVGSVKPRRVDVRYVSATNVPLERAVEEKRFRAEASPCAFRRCASARSTSFRSRSASSPRSPAA